MVVNPSTQLELFFFFSTCSSAGAMLASIVSALDASFEEFRAECDALRGTHGEWLRETMAQTEKQILNHRHAAVHALLAVLLPGTIQASL